MTWILMSSIIIVLLTIGTGILLRLSKGFRQKGYKTCRVFQPLAFMPFIAAAVIIMVPEAVSAVEGRRIFPFGSWVYRGGLKHRPCHAGSRVCSGSRWLFGPWSGIRGTGDSGQDAYFCWTGRRDCHLRFDNIHFDIGQAVR